MSMLPDDLRRYPTQTGREGLALRLGLAFDPLSQDWEWEVANPVHFSEWLVAYQEAPLTDDERFSLLEMLVQCVDDLGTESESPAEVEQLPEWRAVAELLRANPRLHAHSIAYWSVLGADDPEQHFAVSLPMRRVWAEVAPSLLSNAGRGAGPVPTG